MAVKIESQNHFDTIQKRKITEEVDSMGEEEIEEGLSCLDQNKIVIDFNAHSNSTLLKKSSDTQ